MISAVALLDSRDNGRTLGGVERMPPATAQANAVLEVHSLV